MATSVSEEALKRHGWGDLSLRQYQLEGVNWLLSCYNNKHGCILGDEMGLGKTCQTIAMLTWLTASSGDERPHLVVCPRSVLENWVQEFGSTDQSRCYKRCDGIPFWFETEGMVGASTDNATMNYGDVHVIYVNILFAPKVKVKAYIGDKDTRANLSKMIKKSRNGLGYCFDVLVTTYEICLKDFLFLQKLSWHVLVVDEGHRLKNSESLLYRTLEQWDIQCHVLLTGTPIQNDLGELYALLAFIDRKQFKPSRLDSFTEKYNSSDKDTVEELHSLLKPYLLRRTKSGVLKDLPEKSDVVLYHSLSKLQKKLYKAILMKDIEAFENPYSSGQTRLMNILMQLRKCVNHPYLFDGVEPEPFELGEHLVEASAKLVLIDHLLKWLHANDHKVLLFSQMTHMLDIVQDYLGYRGFTYERLDGSVRGEERFLAVQNFNQNEETFVFLLSTKAGGQGLNLTAADTVIFVDSDFNPQNDLQAAARAHRIGQNRPVKVIRLIGRNTVEEIILKRAEDKLKLTDTVIEKGEFDSVKPSTSKQSLTRNTGQLQDMLKFGVDTLLKEDAEEEEEVDFTHILGSTVDGEWQLTESQQPEEEEEEEKEEEEKGSEEVEKVPQSMYMFEGHDYSKDTRDTSTADAEAFDTLVQLTKAEKEENSTGERSLRKKGTMLLKGLIPETVGKPRKPLAPEELEARRKKRQEAAEKRAQKAAEDKQRRREALWKKHAYHSVSIVIDSEGEEEEEEGDVDEEGGGGESGEDKPRRSINYVSGDVTQPVATANTPVNIIIHCADDSGSWGRGGLFSALAARSTEPQTQYELAGKVKDLHLGDCHLIPLTSAQAPDDDGENAENEDLLGLIIAQSRDRHNRLSGIKLPALREGLEKVYYKARHLKASVHLPRIGHDTPGFNWYGTERLIHKILASKGIPTFIYYFPRKKALKRKQSDPASPPSKVSKNNVHDDDDDGDTDDYNDDTPSTSRHSRSHSSSASAPAPKACPSASPSALDDFFSGVAVHLYGLSLDAMTKYKRNIIAYDGDVDSYVHSSTTHLVVSPEIQSEEVKRVRGTHRCHVVSAGWLDECVKQSRLVPTAPYTLDV